MLSVLRCTASLFPSLADSNEDKGNKIQGPGFRALADALKANSTIKTLDARGTLLPNSSRGLRFGRLLVGHVALRQTANKLPLPH